MVLLLHALNLAFAKIPIGLHTFSAFVAISVIATLISLSFRNTFETMVPFEAVFVGSMDFIICDAVFGMIKFIPVKDKRTGQTKKWAIGEYNNHHCIGGSNTHIEQKSQELGYICPHRIDSISKREPLLN